MRSLPPASHGLTAVLLAASLTAALPAWLNAQSTERQTSGPLYDELARMDSLLVETAFVTCDAEAFR